MKIKKFLGASNYEVMTQLKSELGSDAIVLATREVRQKGLFGIFRKPMIEITAAYEDEKKSDAVFRENHKLSQLSEEVRSLKDAIKNIEKNSIKIENKHLIKYSECLLRSGLKKSIADEIVYEINAELKNLPNEDEDFIVGEIRKRLAKIIGESEPVHVVGKGGIVIFVGPTGVGKTTTLANLASKLVIEGHYDIGLVTADTYRIAAVEQLKIYSDILNLPLEVAYNADEVERYCRKMSDKDLVFVDTAGRSHKDREQTDELKDIILKFPSAQVFLVLSADYSHKSLEKMLERYLFLSDYRLIITKIDESEGFGNIVNLISTSGRKVSYFTDGQNVPDDIMLASQEVILKDMLEAHHE